MNAIYKELPNASATIGVYKEGNIDVVVGSDHYREIVTNILEKMSVPDNTDVIYSDSVLKELGIEKSRFDTRVIFLITKTDEQYYFYLQEFNANSTDKDYLKTVKIHLRSLEELDKESFFDMLENQENLKSIKRALKDLFEKHKLQNDLEIKLSNNSRNSDKLKL